MSLFLGESVKGFMTHYRVAIATLSSIVIYTEFKDYNRYRDIAKTFREGRITCHSNKNIFHKYTQQSSMGKFASGREDQNVYEELNFGRHRLETDLREPLSESFTSRYYVIKGEAGTGKSRILKELTKQAMADQEQGRVKGAPVYVLAGQGSSFADNLAETVGFDFDEHMNLKFLISCAMQIQQLPDRSEPAKLHRTLEAIEKGCKLNRDRGGFASVLIIDAVDSLSDCAIRLLRQKAKLWADSNMCKVVFVSSESRLDNLLQENASDWSRAAEPLYIDDLTENEALTLLQTRSKNQGQTKVMEIKEAQRIFELVGGRMDHLLACKRNYKNGITFEEMREKLVAKERGKFIKVSQEPEMWKAVEIIKNNGGKPVLLGELVKMTSHDIVNHLADMNIIRFQSSRSGILAKFQSPLLSRTIDEFYEEIKEA